MKKSILTATVALLVAAGAGASAQTPEHKRLQPTPSLAADAAVKFEAKALDEARARHLKTLGAEAFGVKWRRKTVAASDRGFEVITDGATTLSHRPAGGVYFVQNLRAPMGREPGFQGSDEDYISRGKAMLKAIDADPGEVAEAKVLQQFTQAAKIDSSGRAILQKPKADRRTLLLTRAVEGLPVWSSRLMLDLNRDGSIAAMEIAWPRISPEVLKEGLAMREAAGANFRAPERPYAKIESAEAGILHSPAASFIDDQAAAIRVIYRSDDPTVGKKGVSYLSLDGTEVALPRQVEAFREEEVGARKGEQTDKGVEPPKEPR